MIKLDDVDKYLDCYLEFKEDAQVLKILNLQPNTHPLKINKLSVNLLILRENEIICLYKICSFPEPLGALEGVQGAVTVFQDTGRPGSAVQRGVKTFLLSELREQVEHGSITVPGEPIKLLCPELTAQDIKRQLAPRGWAEIS